MVQCRVGEVLGRKWNIEKLYNYILVKNKANKITSTCLHRLILNQKQNWNLSPYLVWYWPSLQSPG